MLEVAAPLVDVGHAVAGHAAYERVRDAGEVFLREEEAVPAVAGVFGESVTDVTS